MSANKEPKVIKWYASKKEMGHFTEEERRNIHSSKFKNTRSSIRNTLLKNSKNVDGKYCRSAVDDAFISYWLTYGKHIITESRANTILAFAVIKLLDSMIEVEIICNMRENKEGGSRILQKIKDYFKAHPEFESITLSSVDTAIPFYERKGFHLTGEKLPNDLVVMKFVRDRNTTVKRKRVNGSNNHN